jgi:hypothetical protein
MRHNQHFYLLRASATTYTIPLSSYRHSTSLVYPLYHFSPITSLYRLQTIHQTPGNGAEAWSKKETSVAKRQHSLCYGFSARIKLQSYPLTAQSQIVAPLSTKRLSKIHSQNPNNGLPRPHPPTPDNQHNELCLKSPLRPTQPLSNPPLPTPNNAHKSVLGLLLYRNTTLPAAFRPQPRIDHKLQSQHQYNLRI